MFLLYLFLFLLQEYCITVARDVSMEGNKKRNDGITSFFTLSPPLNRWENTFTSTIIALNYKNVNSFAFNDYL